MPTLAELLEAATSATEPALISADLPQPGGIDPLGLRQINFDLMDQVFPGINNIVWHIRPFTVVAWAWRRAAQIAARQGMLEVPVSTLRDFVDRIEVIFVWSQFLRDPGCRLPGRDVMAPLLERSEYRFGGADWEKRKKVRTNSTALSAPINYGPALKNLGWLQADHTGALTSTAAVQDALAVLDDALHEHLDHPAFSEFGAVRVSRDEVESWADAWALDQPAKAEKRVMAELMNSEPRRSDGIALVTAAVEQLDLDAHTGDLRRAMCGAPTNFNPPTLGATLAAWRALQNRQAFRLALEAAFCWVYWRLVDGPATTAALAQQFIKEAGDAATVGAWLDEARLPTKGPTDWIDNLHDSVLDDDHWHLLPAAIRGTLSACLAEAPDTAGTERQDRLPLARAAQEASGWRESQVKDFLIHVLDSWVIGQHVYWAVGRGLADARARARPILRLKITLEEQGWTLMPGAEVARPRTTADRLETMVNLMREADLL